MANYDSDSSDDGNEYTTTSVILGYAADESGGDDVSHLGGHPKWLDPKSRPTASFAKCKVCNNYMSLLLQLNADLQQHFPNDSRRLHVWICRNKTCARKPGSIRAYREVRKGGTNKTTKARESVAQPQQTNINLGNALFGGTALPSGSNTNPFSTHSGLSSGAANPFSSSVSPPNATSTSAQASGSDRQPLAETFANKLKIGNEASPVSTVSDPWPETEAFPQTYPFFYLDAYPEELEPTSVPAADSIAESSKTKYDVEEPSSSAAEKDTFESALDKTFQKFSDIVAQNPEQVLRYEFKGQPLLYSGTDGVASRFVVPHGKSGAVKGIPRCEKCGSQRVFEIQLMPYCIYEIEKDEVLDIDNGMEWGTIIVGTCVNNCGDEEKVAFREEWVGAQWEERVARK